MQATEITILPLVAGAGTGGVWLWANRRLFGDLLSPFNLLFVCWVGPLFLQAANLSSFELPWTRFSSSIVAWVTFALVGTCLLTAWALRGRPLGTMRERAAFAELGILLRDPVILLLFLVIYAVAFLAYLYAEFLTSPYGVPLVTVLSEGTVQIDSIHRWGKDTRWTVLIGLLFVLTPLAYLAAKANADRPLLRRLLWAATIAFPLFGFLKLSRTDVFLVALGIGVAAWYWRVFMTERRGITTVEKLRVVAVALAALALYYGMLAVRLGKGLENLYPRLIGFRLPAEGSFAFLTGPLSAIYGYTAMPFDNLNRFLMTHPWQEIHPGVSVTRPFLSVTGWGDLADRLDALIYYPRPATFAAGSATFLTSVYAEGGILGAVLVPILYGVIVNSTYFALRTRPSLWTLLLYANFVYPWVWLFFNNGMGVLTTYLNAMFVVGMMLVVSEFWRVRAQRPVLAAT